MFEFKIIVLLSYNLRSGVYQSMTHKFSVDRVICNMVLEIGVIIFFTRILNKVVTKLYWELRKNTSNYSSSRELNRVFAEADIVKKDQEIN